MAGTRDAAATAATGRPTWWDSSWSVFDRWTPYVLLGASTVMSVLSPDQPSDAWVGTLVLVGAAVVWIAVGHTTAPPQRRVVPAYAMIYLAGLLAFATVLMSRDLIFFVFAISGFLHASVLRPLPLVFVGTGATSLAILYFTWQGWPDSTGEWFAFGSVLVVQTFLIGFGVAGGEKLAALSEERRTTLAELEVTLSENEALQEELVRRAREAGIADERQRMAREIHDTLAQGLTGVITQLEAADQSEQDPPTRRRHLDNAAQIARQSLTEARRSVQALAPGPLEHGRLPAALDEHVRDWSQLNGIPAETVMTGAEVSLPADAEVALLRVAQEALTNVGKHADASRVGVTLSLLDDQVMLDIRDDGRGFDPDTSVNGSSFGLTAMRQRVGQLGGTLTVESRPRAGTAISVSIPLDGRRSTDA